MPNDNKHVMRINFLSFQNISQFKIPLVRGSRRFDLGLYERDYHSRAGLSFLGGTIILGWDYHSWAGLSLGEIVILRV